jgi:hypothetical protein
MTNENTLSLVLGSNKNGGDLLCSQTPLLFFENELEKSIFWLQSTLSMVSAMFLIGFLFFLKKL